jgi:hypothetical protein
MANVRFVPDSAPLSDVSPVVLAQALAWRSARFGVRQSRRAVRHLPAAARELRALAPKGPFARAAENGYSLWSAEAKFCVASVKSLGSAYSVWSVLSGGSAASLFSVGSILSIGSAGSILSIGSVGSILSIGSAGSVCSIGAVGQLRLPLMASDALVVDVVEIADGSDDGAVEPEPPMSGPQGLSVLDRGATLLGLLALGASVARP